MSNLKKKKYQGTNQSIKTAGTSEDYKDQAIKNIADKDYPRNKMSEIEGYADFFNSRRNNKLRTSLEEGEYGGYYGGRIYPFDASLSSAENTSLDAPLAKDTDGNVVQDPRVREMYEPGSPLQAIGMSAGLPVGPQDMRAAELKQEQLRLATLARQRASGKPGPFEYQSKGVKVDWSKAPKLNTQARRDWYTANNLKQDETTVLKKKSKPSTRLPLPTVKGAMYKAGGFLASPSTHDLDED